MLKKKRRDAAEGAESMIPFNELDLKQRADVAQKTSTGRRRRRRQASRAKLAASTTSASFGGLFDTYRQLESAGVAELLSRTLHLSAKEKTSAVVMKKNVAGASAGSRSRSSSSSRSKSTSALENRKRSLRRRTLVDEVCEARMMLRKKPQFYLH